MTATVPTIGVVIRNDSRVTIPPRSVVVVTSVEINTDNPEGLAIHHVTQYSGQKGNIFVTGPQAILGGHRGVAYSDQFIYVTIDPAVLPPLVGEQWGPIAGAWTIGRGGMGFYCQGYANTTSASPRAMFMRGRAWCYAKLSAGLLAGSASAPSTVTYDVWHPDPASSATFPPLIVSPNAALLTRTCPNYDPSLTGSIGFLGQIHQDPSGRSVYWMGCSN